MKHPFLNHLKERLKKLQEHPEIKPWLAMVRPKPPYDRDALVAACITLTSMMSLLLLAGISLISLGSLFLALLLMFLILTQIFGIEMRLNPEMMFS